MLHAPYMRFAWAELGVKETPGPQSTPRISEYLKAAGLAPNDEIPWCSSFVNWCLQNAEIPSTHSGLARSWLTWGSACVLPKYGAICVFEREGSPTSGHVGFFVDHLPSGQLLILGGNQNDAVSLAKFDASALLASRFYVG